MGRRVEDLKESAPCGMLIHYTIDKSTDFVTYNDINGRGNYRFSNTCNGCTWRALCQPTEADYLQIVRETTGHMVEPMEIIEQLFRNREVRT